jgi:hypothetical protein
MLSSYVIPKNYNTATDYSVAVRGASGKRGRVEYALVYDITEAFFGTTTGAQVRVTDNGGNLYFESDETLLSSVAIGSSVSLANNLNGAPFEIGRDEEIVLTFVAPTGTTPTGKALIEVFIDWY